MCCEGYAVFYKKLFDMGFIFAVLIFVLEVKNKILGLTDSFGKDNLRKSSYEEHIFFNTFSTLKHKLLFKNLMIF